MTEHQDEPNLASETCLAIQEARAVAQPRMLTAEEVKTVAGGPIIQNENS